MSLLERAFSVVQCLPAAFYVHVLDDHTRYQDSPSLGEVLAQPLKQQNVQTGFSCSFFGVKTIKMYDSERK